MILEFGLGGLERKRCRSHSQENKENDGGGGGGQVVINKNKK